MGYGLIIGLISVVSLTAIKGSGDSVSDLFGRVSGEMGAVAGSGGSGGGASDGQPAPSASPDNVPPVITSVTTPPNGQYAGGEQLIFILSFDEVVTSTAGPYLGVEVGSDVLQAQYSSGSGTTELTFAATLPANASDLDGIRLQPNLRNSDGVRDGGNNQPDNRVQAQDLPNVTVVTTFADCQAARTAGATDDGVYQIDTTGGDPSDAYQIWCDMDGSTGWTLIMKAGSSSQTLHYDSSYWTNSSTLNDSGTPSLADGDAKYRSFSELGVTELRGCMDGTCFTYSSGLNGSSPARDLFAGSNNQRYSDTIPSRFSQMDSCSMFGLNNNNLHGDSNGAGVRFGWVSNNGNCNDSENAIGFGVRNMYDGDFRASAAESCPLTTTHCDQGYVLQRYSGTLWAR
ncbi:MAG: hypothetical protein Alpg2KO_19610 [Alphaproteobacteria bacterium]